MDRVAWESAVRGSKWAQGLKRRAGAVAGLLQHGEASFVELGHGIGASTPMEVGSVTKPFTGLLLAEAVRRGEVRLSSRVDELVLDERWAGAPAITLLELATHTAGLPKLSMPGQVGLIGDPYRWYGEDHLVRYLRKTKPRTPEEPKLAYSNLGFAVLGLALARAAGKPYEELLQERVLAPLEMKLSALQRMGGGDLVAGGYNVFGLRARPWHFRAYAPCGALVSTAEDMLRTAGALGDPAGPLADAVALAAERQVEIPGGSIGLAWRLPKGRDWLWHNGGTYGYQACVALLRGRGVAMVLMANQFGAKAMTELARELMRKLEPHSHRTSPAGMAGDTVLP